MPGRLSAQVTPAAGPAASRTNADATAPPTDSHASERVNQMIAEDDHQRSCPTATFPAKQKHPAQRGRRNPLHARSGTAQPRIRIPAMRGKQAPTPVGFADPALPRKGPAR